MVRESSTCPPEPADITRGGAVKGLPVIIAVAKFRLAGVQPHAHLQPQRRIEGKDRQEPPHGRSLGGAPSAAVSKTA